MLCRDISTDSLYRAMIARYRLVPVEPPQAHLPLGSVLAFDGSRCLARSELPKVVASGFRLPKVSSTPMRHLLDRFSDKHGFDAGLGLFGGFLTAIGAGGLVARIAASASGNHATSLQLNLTGGVEQSIDPVEPGSALDGLSLRPGTALERKGVSLYVVCRTWSATKLRVVFLDASGARLRLDAKAIDAAGLEAHAGMTQVAGNGLSFETGTPACFAIDGYRLSVTDEDLKLDLREGIPGPSRGSTTEEEEDDERRQRDARFVALSSGQQGYADPVDLPGPQ